MSSTVAGKPWPLDAERDILRDACAPGRSPNSLWNFIRFAAGWHWRILGSNRLYWLSSTFHKPMVADVQRRIESWRAARLAGRPEPLRILMVLFRGSGKTNGFTTILPEYLALDEPNISVSIGSATHPKAREFLSQIKPILDGTDEFARFTWLYGNWKDPSRTWSEESIVFAAKTATATHEPSIGTFGVETGITGQHPLFCGDDDPLIQEKLNDGGVWNAKAIKSLKSIRYAFIPETFFFLAGTRYLEDDPIGHSLRTHGYASWYGHPPLEKFPQREDGFHVYHFQARDIANTTNYPKGEPVLPEAGLTNDALEQMERDDPIMYAAQMMNNPRSSPYQEITRAQVEPLLIERSSLPDIAHATIHLDTAFLADADKRRLSGDRSVIAVMLHDLRPNGMVYLDNIYAETNCRSEDFDDALIWTLQDLRRRRIRVATITDEKEIGGKEGMYRRHLETLIMRARLRPPQIIQISRAGKNKELRIRKSVGYWLEGYIRLINDAKNLNLLIDEITSIGYSAHDDIADACSDVFHPEVWRPPNDDWRDDDQPRLPRQPGDEFIKGWTQDMQDIEHQLRTQASWNEEDDAPDSYLEQHG